MKVDRLESQGLRPVAETLPMSPGLKQPTFVTSHNLVESIRKEKPSVIGGNPYFLLPEKSIIPISDHIIL
jgi:hypothetical protein